MSSSRAGLVRTMLLMTAVGTTSLSGAATLAQVVPTIEGVVLDSSDPPMPVKSIRVTIRTPKGENLGRGLTDDEGRYDIECNRAVNRIEVYFLDADDAKGYYYRTPNFLNLSGLRNMVLNPIVFRESSPAETAAQFSAWRRLVRMLNPELPEDRDDRTLIQNYVVHAVAAHPAGEDFGFARELSEIVTTLNRPPGEASTLVGRLAVEQDKVVYLDAQGTRLNIEPLPRAVFQPQRMVGEQGQILLNLDGPVDEMLFAPTNQGLKMFANLGRFGRMRPYEGQFDLDRSEVKWTLVRGGEDVTSAAGGKASPWLIRGSSDGSITIASSQNPTLSRTLQVGPMPVEAAASSQDGTMFGGASLDGAYKVWRLQEEGRLDSAKLIVAGTLPSRFPVSMEFSPDNEMVLIGTGLGSRDGAIVAISLADGDQKRIVAAETSAAVTRIEFGRDSERFIATQHDGATVVASLRRQNGEMEVRKNFALRGIEAVTFGPNGDTAILTVEGVERPILFPTEQLLRRSTFDTPQLGIELGDF